MRKGGVVPLHTGGGRCVGVGQCAVDDVEAALALIQPHFEVGSAGPWVVLVAPLDVKDPVGRSATNRGKDARASHYRVQVVPVGEDGVHMGYARQAGIGEDRGTATELQCAVGVRIRSGKALVV